MKRTLLQHQRWQLLGQPFLGALMAALSACGNTPTEARPELVIRIDGPAVVTSALAPEDGVQCAFQVTATAEGSGRARWTGTHFTWRDPDTGVVLGSGGWDAEGVRRFWAAEGIAEGEVLASRGGAIGGSRAFQLDATFGFVAEGSGAPSSTDYTFVCRSPAH